MSSGQNIQGALNYNEQKVVEGKARLIKASGFLKDVPKLNFYEKLRQFTDLNEKNTRTKTNTLHISLNFDPSEKLDAETLNNIAAAYMNKIGFGQQPYLVYEHTDAAHPHIHIVTTLIKEDGKRIPIHNLGRNESEKARKEIEIEFNLVKAEGRQQKELVHPVNVAWALAYGKSETKRSISNVVRMVTARYRYTSLPELNAVLKQFNVMADRGSEDSQMYQKKGLLYSMLDRDGKKIGIPIKASSIYGKPTLPFLEKQYALNEALRKPFRDDLKRTIDKALKGTGDQETFTTNLRKENIYPLFRSNEAGRIYGITFVDNRNKTVFNGSDLGKQYGVKSILERLQHKPDPTAFRPGYSDLTIANNTSEATTGTGLPKITNDLIHADGYQGATPEAMLKLKKKRRKGRSL